MSVEAVLAGSIDEKKVGSAIVVDVAHRDSAAGCGGEVEVLHRVRGVNWEDVVDSGGEGSNRWFHLVIMEGRKREVRRLWEAVGVTVSRLKRVRYGPIILDSRVKAGQWRDLGREERRELLAVAGIQDRRPWGSLEQRAKKGPEPVHSPWKKNRRR